jgi:predicted acylesterase/phospholipase RssA
MIEAGGGAGAAYGVGVAKALIYGESPATNYVPIDPEIYTGTSGGAFNAAFMASQPSKPARETIRDLERAWVDGISDNPQRCGNGVYRVRGNILAYFNLRCYQMNPVQPLIDLAGDAVFLARDLFRRSLVFLLSSGSLERRIFEFADISQLIDDTPFRRGLPGLLDLAGIRQSEKILKVIATNWNSGDVAIFGNSDMTDEVGYELLSGSAAIPGIFQPHYAGGIPYIDGGLVMNVPLMPAIDAGADTLHIIYYDPEINMATLRQFANTVDIIDRARMVDWASRLNEDIATANWINQGLELLERLGRGGTLTPRDEAIFIRVAAKIRERIRQGRPYRKLTIHRYHPHDDPMGFLGRLNFNRDFLISLIERGFTDAVAHDCVASECLLPERGEEKR